jgi:endogenous inhibitor of DNA gyrase (YacG/DUF329 family)
MKCPICHKEVPDLDKHVKMVDAMEMSNCSKCGHELVWSFGDRKYFCPYCTKREAEEKKC